MVASDAQFPVGQCEGKITEEFTYAVGTVLGSPGEGHLLGILLGEHLQI